MDWGKSKCAQLRVDYLVVNGMLLWAGKLAVEANELEGSWQGAKDGRDSCVHRRGLKGNLVRRGE